MATKKLTRHDHQLMAFMLREAKQELWDGKGRQGFKNMFVCHALDMAARRVRSNPGVSVSLSYRLADAQHALSDWIYKLLDSHVSLERWMRVNNRRPGDTYNNTKMQKIRHQWVDWMIATLEKED